MGEKLIAEWLGYLLLIACACLIAFIVSSVLYSAMTRSKREGLRHFANEMDMEILSSDEANVSIFAGEVHNRPSSIRMKAEKKSGTKISVFVECDSKLSFKVIRKNLADQKAGSEKSGVEKSSITFGGFDSFEANGLSIESSEPAKTTAIFREPETIHTILDLISETGATCVELANRKVVAVIKEASNNELSPQKMALVLERLDRFARLLEFVSAEEHASEN